MREGDGHRVNHFAGAVAPCAPLAKVSAVQREILDAMMRFVGNVNALEGAVLEAMHGGELAIATAAAAPLADERGIELSGSRCCAQESHRKQSDAFQMIHGNNPGL